MRLTARHSLSRPPAATAGIAVGIAISTIGALASPEPLVVVACGFVPVILIALLWRRDEPPLLLVPLLFQWSEVAILPISSIWQGKTLNELAEYGADLHDAAYFGLAAITAMAIGMSIGEGARRPIPEVQDIRNATFAAPFSKIRNLILILMVAGYLLAFISARVGGLGVILIEMANIKYIGLFILCFWCLARAERYSLLSIVMAFEILFGLTGFLAEFKYSLLTFLTATLGAQKRLTGRAVAGILIASFIMIFVAIFWSAIKANYRVFVSSGTGEQLVTQPLIERLRYLQNVAANFGAEDFAYGFNRLVARHGYIEFLALTMRHVPDVAPHENGRLTLDALLHVVQPRLLFPDKMPLPSDTDVLVKYTGMPFQWDKKVSVSIGYLGELYVDFGVVGAIFATFALGLILGRAHRAFVRNSQLNALLAYAVFMLPALSIAYFGTAWVKLLSELIYALAIAAILNRVALSAISEETVRYGQRRKLEG